MTWSSAQLSPWLGLVQSIKSSNPHNLFSACSNMRLLQAIGQLLAASTAFSIASAVPLQIQERQWDRKVAPKVLLIDMVRTNNIPLPPHAYMRTSFLQKQMSGMVSQSSIYWQIILRCRVFRLSTPTYIALQPRRFVRSSLARAVQSLAIPN